MAAAGGRMHAWDDAVGTHNSVRGQRHWRLLSPQLWIEEPKKRVMWLAASVVYFHFIN